MLLISSRKWMSCPGLTALHQPHLLQNLLSTPPVLEGSKERRKTLQVQKSPEINEQIENDRKWRQLCCVDTSNLLTNLKGEKSRLLEDITVTGIR